MEELLSLPDGKPYFVWRSTPQSVEDGTFSALALAEVVAAICLYLGLAYLLDTQALLWASLVIAPLLLLRSEESVALGVTRFEQYVDRSFADVSHLPANVFWSPRFISSVLLECLSTALAAYLLSRLLLPGSSLWSNVLLGMAVGYLASQVALAIIVFEAAKEVAAQAESRLAASVVGILLIVATASGVALAGQEPSAILSAISITIALTLTGVLQAPHAIAAAMTRAQSREEGRVRGVTFAREAIRTAGIAFAAFTPGICVGGWLRSLAIRVFATLPHLRSGLAALPDNWYRTLFVIDVCYPPEIIPGYHRSDLFNVSYFLSRIRTSESFHKRYVSLIASLILFVPAYFYRLTIKSTCWAYLPLIYIARHPDLARNPAYLSDLLWWDIREWGRRLAMLATAAGIAITNIQSLQHMKAALPPVLVSPLEYMFLIDLKRIEPWQWLNISDAALTFILLLGASRLRIMVWHDRDDIHLSRSATVRAFILELLVRIRTAITWVIAAIVFLHGILWVYPLLDHLTSYLADFLQSLYGHALPPTRTGK